MLQQIQETMKKCNTCEELLPLTEFHKNKNSKDGHMHRCKKCRVYENFEQHKRNNPRRMWVPGSYISTHHPLYKPGRYKNFEQAAFSSLEKYESSVEGQVYVITNPNFPDWVKVGMAIDAEDRLNNYQTSSPFRDYVLQYYYDVNNRRAAENEAHTELQKSYERKGEWFKCTPEEARVVVSSTAEEYK